MEVILDLNYTVAVLNMGIFFFLLEGLVIYKKEKEKIKSSISFLFLSLLFIYIIDMLILVLLNAIFKWYKDSITLFFSQTPVFMLMSLIYAAYYLLLRHFKK